MMNFPAISPTVDRDFGLNLRDRVLLDRECDRP